MRTSPGLHARPARRGKRASRRRMLSLSGRHQADDPNGDKAHTAGRAGWRPPRRLLSPHRECWKSMCDARSHVVSELHDWRIARCDVERVVPGPCSMACPHLGVRRRLLVGGVRSPGESPRAARSIRAATGEGNGRTGELLELSLMPRQAEPRAMGCRSGVQGLAAVERQAPVKESTWPGRAPPSPG